MYKNKILNHLTEIIKIKKPIDLFLTAPAVADLYGITTPQAESILTTLETDNLIKIIDHFPRKYILNSAAQIDEMHQLKPNFPVECMYDKRFPFIEYPQPEQPFFVGVMDNNIDQFEKTWNECLKNLNNVRDEQKPIDRPLNENNLKPENYIFIAAWCEINNLYDCQQRQEKAYQDNAPVFTVYFCPIRTKWVQIHDLESTELFLNVFNVAVSNAVEGNF